LFTAIGTTFGVGDGSTTFTLPDLRGRVPVGRAGSIGSASADAAAMTLLGGTGGEWHTGHSLALASATYTFSLPPHTHRLNALAVHSHTFGPPLILRNPGFENIRHSISPRHSYYEQAVDWGNAWLRRNGY
jgi:microcystin-dependent protein